MNDEPEAGDSTTPGSSPSTEAKTALQVDADSNLVEESDEVRDETQLQTAEKPINTEVGEGSSTAGTIWFRWSHIWSPIDDLLLDTVALHLPLTDLPKADPMLGVFFAIQKRFPDLMLPPKGHIADNSNATFQTVMALAREHAPAGRHFIARWRVLEVLDAGNRLEYWRIRTSTVPAPLPPQPRAFFSAEGFEQMVRHQDLFEQFLKSLAAPLVGPENSTLAWGQILGAQLLFGALFQPDWLWALPEAVRQAPSHLHWLDLERSVPSTTARIQRRHYLDPVSRALLLRWRDHGWPVAPNAERSTRKLLRDIRAYAREHGFQHLVPRTWTNLRNVSLTRMSLHIPPHLLGQAAGYYTSASLPIGSMTRLIQPFGKIDFAERYIDDAKATLYLAEDNALPEASSMEEQPSVADGEQPVESEGVDWDIPDVPGYVQTLSTAIRRSSSTHLKPLREWITEQDRADTTRLTPIPLSLRRLAEWVEKGLFKRRRGGRAVSTKTAYDRFITIRDAIVGRLGNEDPASIEGVDDFIELYTNALDDAFDSAKRKRIAVALSSFHEFLVTKHKAPSLEGSGLFEVRHRQLQVVDANLLDPDAFEWVLRLLAYDVPDHPEVADLRILIACLGYYAGMRRSEPIGLRLEDLDGPPSWDLVIRPNSTRQLKSSSAFRVAPLGILLPKVQLERLQKWYYARRQWALDHGHAPADVPLFNLDPVVGGGSTGDPRRWADQHLKAIKDALVRATGDPHLRYHHLRHSFANRMLLGLWGFENRSEAPLGRLLERLAGSTEFDRVRRCLLGTAPVQRRSLRLVSMLMGHSTTAITMNHYIHCADLLLGRAVHWSVPDLSAASIAGVAGCKEEDVVALRRLDVSLSTADILERLTERALKPTDRLPKRRLTATREFARPENVFLRFELMTDALNHQTHPSGRSPYFTYPWSSDQLERWERMLNGLSEDLRKAPTGYGAPLLEPPRTQQDRRLAELTLDSLLGQRSLFRAKERRALLNAFIEGKRVTGPIDVLFERVPQFKQWVRLLETIKRMDGVDIFHIASTARAASGPEQQREYWQSKSPIQISDWAGQDIGLQENSRSFPARGKVLCARRCNAATQDQRWVYGICWAMVIAWLVESGGSDLLDNGVRTVPSLPSTST